MTNMQSVVERSMAMATGHKVNEATPFSLDNLIKYARIHNIIPPWWSVNRDAAMREFWKDGAYLGSIMGLAQIKLANIPITIVARDTSVASHVEQAGEMTEQIRQASEFGETLSIAIEKFVEDYLGQDNGGFLELIGDGRPDGPIEGPVHAVRHWDASLCTRTGNPMYPVRVRGDDNRNYNIFWGRVIFASQMPSAKRRMFGVGYCSVSRSVAIAESLSTMLNYMGEKMGSRPKSKMLVGAGIKGQELIQAMAIGEVLINELGLKNYARIVAIGGDKDLKVDAIDLNTFDPFDQEKMVTLGHWAFANAWGLEPSEIFPSSGGEGSEQASLTRARGKLPARFVRIMEDQLSLKLAPRHLKVVLDYHDDQQDHNRAVIEDIHARNVARRIASKVSTIPVERRLLLENGTITREQYNEMELSDKRLPDGAHVGSLFFNPRYTDLILVPRDLLVVQDSNAGEAIKLIQANKAGVFGVLGQTTSTAVTRRCNEALAALGWLEEQYAPIIQQERMELQQSGNPAFAPKPKIVEAQRGRPQLEGKEVAVPDTSVMVALYLPDSLSVLLPGMVTLPEGSEPVPSNEYHLTLIYLGKTTDLDKARLQTLVSAWARVTPPVVGTLGGVGRFVKDVEGRNPFYITFDSPDLPGLRERLAKTLELSGIVSESEHGFIPHITFGYIPTDAPTPSATLLQDQIGLHEVVLAWGGVRYGYTLEGNREVAKDTNFFAPSRTLARLTKSRQMSEVT